MLESTALSERSNQANGSPGIVRYCLNKARPFYDFWQKIDVILEISCRFFRGRLTVRHHQVYNITQRAPLFVSLCRTLYTYGIRYVAVTTRKSAAINDFKHSRKT